MKKLFAILLIASLAGCATSQAVLPSLEGKPRVKINAPMPTEAEAEPVLVAPVSGDLTVNNPKE